MERTCLKTQNLQNSCKMFGERCKTSPFLTSFSKVLQNSFKVIYRDKTTLETSTLPAICAFNR